MATKQLNIETLRGITILLVVIGHVIGSGPTGGMKIDFPSPWRYIYLWIDYFQMPLFTAIAGWVYALKPPKSATWGDFICKKALRLLIPMAIVGTCYFLLQYITPGTNRKGDLTEIWRIYIFPYTIYWYLPSLFLIFLSMFFIDKMKYCNQVSKWGILLITAWGFHIFEQSCLPWNTPNIFSFRGALNQLPYFIAGVGILRFSNQLFSRTLKSIYILFSLIGLILLQFKWFYQVGDTIWYNTLLPIWVTSSLMLLLHQKYINTFFVWLGGYAYTIYLFHGFGTSGGRIILSHLGVHNQIIVFLFALIIALFCPILVEKVCLHWKITRILFLGKK